MAGERTAEVLEGMMAARAARYWWMVLVAGIGWLIIAWVVLRMDLRSLVAVGVLLGVLFLGSAINEAAFAGMVMGGWRYLHYGMAVLFLLASVWSFVRPVNTFFALASVLGLILVFYGAFEVVRSLGSRGENPFWWMGLITGLLLLLLGFWVSSSDREFALGRRTVLILLWVGFMALFRGVSEIMLAFGLRRLRPAGATSPSPGPAMGETAVAGLPRRSGDVVA